MKVNSWCETCRAALEEAEDSKGEMLLHRLPLLRWQPSPWPIKYKPGNQENCSRGALLWTVHAFQHWCVSVGFASVKLCSAFSMAPRARLGSWDATKSSFVGWPVPVLSCESSTKHLGALTMVCPPGQKQSHCFCGEIA